MIWNLQGRNYRIIVTVAAIILRVHTNLVKLRVEGIMTLHCKIYQISPKSTASSAMYLTVTKSSIGDKEQYITHADKVIEEAVHKGAQLCIALEVAMVMVAAHSCIVWGFCLSLKVLQLEGHFNGGTSCQGSPSKGIPCTCNQNERRVHQWLAQMRVIQRMRMLNLLQAVKLNG
ncbi:hypothetical protein MKW92_004578 [Papaver armeniacum]|nr:hypothetical protein MKW92_004578 [Papaver armeniacum]